MRSFRLLPNAESWPPNTRYITVRIRSLTVMERCSRRALSGDPVTTYTDHHMPDGSQFARYFESENDTSNEQISNTTSENFASREKVDNNYDLKTDQLGQSRCRCR